MADDFDRMLASALSPDERLPDRRFVALVQARIALEDQLAAEGRAQLMSLGGQLAGLLAVAAAVAVIARSDILVGLFAESPAAGLAILLLIFSFLVMLLTAGGASRRISEA
jgi:hypothetical protein